MKKLNNPTTLLTIVAMAFLAFGCAQVDYPCITDEGQANAGTGSGNDEDTGNPGTGGFINTNGKAHIDEFIQIAVILPDGTTVEMVNFLDQKATASGAVSSDLYNYEHRHTIPSHIFHDDQYCNPDWTGCSAATNTDNAFCGDGKGGISIASGPCSDGLMMLFGDIVRDNECGRADLAGPQAKLGGLSILDAISMISNNSSLEQFNGSTWHAMTLAPSVTFNYANGNSYAISLPAAGIPARMQLAGGFHIRALIDLSDPAVADTLHQLQAIADANPGQYFNIAADLFGYSLNLSGDFRLVDADLVPGFYTDKATRLYGQ